MKFGIEKIKSLLPHREPFLFIDNCEIIEPGKSGVGFRKFLPDEYFFKGHFPGRPIVPGVILIEALAQTSGVVVANELFSKSSKISVLFTSVSSAKFRKPVVPNDEILFEVKLVNQVKSVYRFYGEALKNSQKVCDSVFSAMIINNN